MILPLFRRSPQRGDTISSLYGVIVAQARSPGFYRDYGVADTFDGRFELILLHLTLVLRRFAADAELRPLGQEIFDLFCRDMDHNLREIGISDLKVPKEMERIGSAFYGRQAAYEAGLNDTDDRGLIEAICRNVYSSPAQMPAGASRLAAYMRDAANMLDGQDTTALLRGQLQFPQA